MTNSFAPMSAAAEGGSPAKAAANPKVTGDFRPITEAGLSSNAASPATQEPKVTLVKNGNRVTSIKVQCVCGHIIELACE